MSNMIPPNKENNVPPRLANRCHRPTIAPLISFGRFLMKSVLTAITWIVEASTMETLMATEYPEVGLIKVGT